MGESYDSLTFFIIKKACLPAGGEVKVDDTYIAKLIREYHAGYITAEELVLILEKRLYDIIKG